jgi:hypothetical protein
MGSTHGSFYTNICRLLSTLNGGIKHQRPSVRVPLSKVGVVPRVWCVDSGTQPWNASAARRAGPLTSSALRVPTAARSHTRRAAGGP